MLGSISSLPAVELSLKFILSQTRNGGKENGPQHYPFRWPAEEEKGTHAALDTEELMDGWCMEKHNTYPGPFSQEAVLHALKSFC